MARTSFSGPVFSENGFNVGGVALRANRQQIVANRGTIHGGLANSGTTYSRGEQRFKLFFGPSVTTDIQFVFGNFQAPGTSAEVDGPNALNIEATLETITPSVAAIRSTFNGVTPGLLNPGGIFAADAMPVSLPANAQAWGRTGVIVNVGQSWPRTSFFAISGEAQYESTASVSQVNATGAMSTPAGGQTAGGGFLPLGIIGVPEKPFPAVGLLGDSIMAGTVGDATSTVNGSRGMYARGLFFDNGTLWPYVMLARASERAEWCAGLSSYLRKYMLQYCTHVICNYGTNDIAAGRTFDQIKADLMSIWDQARARGCKVYQAMILPRVTSSNSFVDIAGQTITAGFGANSTRYLLNQFFQASVGTLIDGVIDGNKYLEDPNNYGRWVVNGSPNYVTSDGTHPNATGAILGAAATKSVAERWTV